MSQAAAQAAAFYQEVAISGRVWGIRDPEGVPASMTPDGRAMPFWSSRRRAMRATQTAPFLDFSVFEIDWEEFDSRWLSGIEVDVLLAGLNWTGPHITGYDVSPTEVRVNVAAARSDSTL